MHFSASCVGSSKVLWAGQLTKGTPLSRRIIAVGSADWHVDQTDRGAWRRRPEIRGDSVHALTQIVDLAVMHEVDLLAAGDLLDTHEQEDPGAVKFLLRELARLGAIGRRALAIQGQHELARLPWLGLSADVLHSHRATTTLGGVSVYGLDYTKPDDLAGAFASVPAGVDVLIMHQVWRDLMGEHINSECCFADVPHARLLLTGDFHRHLVKRAVGASGQDLTVLSPGSACMRSIDEEPEKSVFLLYDDLSVTSVPLRTRRVFRHGAYTRDDLANLLDAVLPGLESPTPGMPSEVETPILHVTYDPDVPDVHRRLSAACRGRFHLFLTPRRVAELYLPGAPELVSEGAQTIALGLEGNLVKVFAADSLEHAVARELLGGVSPAATLAALRARHVPEEEIEPVR